MLIERARNNFRNGIIQTIVMIPLYSIVVLYTIGRFFFPMYTNGYFADHSINISILVISFSLPLILFIKKRSSKRMLLMSVQKYGNADIEIDYLESELEGENEQLFLGEKDKQKYYITKNYIVDWNAVGYSLDSIIKISEIERVNITGIIETRRRYLSKTRIYDTFGKEMYIESAIQTSDSIKDRKRAYEKIIADNEMINKILTMLQERNVNIEIIRDHASEEVTEPSESSYMGQGMSRTSRIYAKGDFHQDDQGHYTEGGLRVDEYGRPIKA